MEKKNVPKIRFPGFTEPWEQRKLSELATIHARIGWQNLRTSEFLDNGDYMLITGTDFKDGAINYSTCHYVEKERYDQDKHIQINNGSILITKDGTLGKVAYVQGLTMPATLNAGIFNVQIRNENEVDGKYLFQYLKAPYLMNYVSQKATGGTIKHLNQNILVDFPIVLPNKFEQVKIGTFFEKLDKLITLHHRKLENLKKQKKGLLQKMFPEKGKKVPEIRFPEFTNDWEQRKVGDYYEFKNGLNKGKEFFGAGTPIVNFTDVFNNRGLIPKQLKGKVRLEPSEIKNYEVKKGDIFFTRTSETIEEIGYPSVMLESCKNTVFSGFVLRGRCFLKDDPLDNLFKKYVFFTDTFRNEMLKKSSMTTRALTSGTAIKNMEFLYPSSKDEQHKIGEYFSKLDNLISLHQRKLEHLQKQKKALLQQMFV